MGFTVMLWGAEKLVPAEYWCPYPVCHLIVLVIEGQTHNMCKFLILCSFLFRFFPPMHSPCIPFLSPGN